MSDELDIEKMKTIGLLGQPYGQPRFCPTEDRYFSSSKEFDDYAKEHNLITKDEPGKCPDRVVYKYDKVLKKVVEVHRG